MTSDASATSATTRAPAWPMPLAVFVVALGVRLWALGEERSGNPLFLEPLLDDRAYLRLADEMRDAAASARPWFLAPLYPWMLAAASIGGAATMLVAGVMSSAIGALTASVVAVAARALHSSAAGWAAGLVYAAAGVVVFSEILPGQEPALCLLHAVALLLVVRHFRGGDVRWTAALFGVVVGVAMLGRATTAVLGVAFALVVAARVRPWPRAWRSIGLAAAGAAVVLVPAAVRNASAFGDFTPLPWSGGPNLYMANGPFSRQYTTFASHEIGFDPDTMAVRAMETAERAEGRALSPSEASAYWTRRTWAERGSVGDMAAHFARKALLFWTPGEIANNHDVTIESRWSAWLRVVPTSSWWLLALGVGGWWIVRRRAPEIDWAAWTFVLSWAALTLYFPLSRYKLPLVPLAVVAAATGVVEFVVARGSRRRAVGAGALVVGCACMTWLGSPPAGHSAGARNLANAFAVRGQLADGVALLRGAIADEPHDDALHESLGRLLVEDGKPAEAVEEFELSRVRGRWTGGIAEIHALVVLGRADAALRTALELDEGRMTPGQRAEFLANWAVAEAASGDRVRAAARLRAAEEIDADAPAVERARRLLSR